jgi:hypothetical protein
LFGWIGQLIADGDGMPHERLTTISADPHFDHKQIAEPRSRLASGEGHTETRSPQAQTVSFLEIRDCVDPSALHTRTPPDNYLNGAA